MQQPETVSPTTPSARAARGRLIERYGGPAPRYTSYPTVPEWSAEFGHEEFAAALARADSQADAPLSLYTHIPFCKSLCHYCGCNVIVSRDSTRADRYLDALERELGLLAAHLPNRRALGQIHWGGGTPTFLTVPQIDRLWGAITRHFSVREGAEIALEINPNTTSPQQLEALAGHGFNRLSMGVQDFDDRVQAAIGRIQSAEHTRTTLERARALGFTGVNFDLIYGLPHQTPARWARTLEQVVEMRPDRIAVFGFAYVPDLRPNQKRLPMAHAPSPAERLDLEAQAAWVFRRAGYVEIGMDHFALPDDPLAKAAEAGTLWRNFQGYTLRGAPDTIASGTTGISDIAGAYAMNPRRLSDWYEAMDAGRFATVRGWASSAEDQRRRALITDLMCNMRLDLDAWPDLVDDSIQAPLEEMEADGLLTLDGATVRMTRPGRPFVRRVALLFDARDDGHAQRGSQVA